MPTNDDLLIDDAQRISHIPFIAALLDVVCAATGMGFAAVARVTPERWIAGAVHDQLRFGLRPGDELPVETTICHEIRRSNKPVIIDHVSFNFTYQHHPTPSLYGFEAYVSFPIVRRSGEVFGTLCAIDPRAAKWDARELSELLTTLSLLIARYLDGEPVPDNDARETLEAMANSNIDTFRRDAGTPNGTLPWRPMQLPHKVRQLLQALDETGA